MKSMKKEGFEKNFRSPVAKHLNSVTKCSTHSDRKNDYKRRPKHKNKDLS